jgi:tRNA pseudouridine65 synthase
MNARIPVIQQSAKWIVINKPVGISVHNETQDVRGVLKKQLRPGSFDDIYPVHRLDKETSGVLMVALEAETASEFAEKFQNRQTEKTYYAILRGALPVNEKWQEWNFPISDKAEGRKNPQGLLKDRVAAKTQYRVLKSNKYFSLVEVNLLTGRQHQIRKHAALAGNPIVGDSRYNDGKYNEKMAELYNNDRMYLHASKLNFQIAGKVQTFETGLPTEFKALLKD